MLILDCVLNKCIYYYYFIIFKRNDYKLYIFLVFCNSMYVYDCMKNFVLNIKINMMMVIICDINNFIVFVFRYCNCMFIYCIFLLKVIIE